MAADNNSQACSNFHPYPGILQHPGLVLHVLRHQALQQQCLRCLLLLRSCMRNWK